MKAAILAFTRRGMGLSLRVSENLPQGSEVRHYAPERLLEPGFIPIKAPLAEFTGPIFSWADALVFVGACGVAVRAIAPWVRDKKQDPAVLVLDEGGNFVISLLSGHIGGANRLTETLAQGLGAVPVITTATDVEGRFSVDQWAAEHGFTISSMAIAKSVSAAILEGEVPICADMPFNGKFPSGLVPGDRGELGIYIGCRDVAPFGQTLRLTPKVLRLGIGCRRGTSREAIESAVTQVLTEHHIRREAIRQAASIDLKAGEAGLLDFCQGWDIPVSFYTAEELRAVPGTFTPSPFVTQVTGVDNVCERAAMKNAEKIIVPKTARDGVTVALAEAHWEVVF